jgi:tetratricopeptide (TPR) repeat protein
MNNGDKVDNIKNDNLRGIDFSELYSIILRYTPIDEEDLKRILRENPEIVSKATEHAQDLKNLRSILGELKYYSQEAVLDNPLKTHDAKMVLTTVLSNNIKGKEQISKIVSMLYYTIAELSSEKKDFDKAIENYDKAIELNRKDFVLYNNRGFAFYKKDDLKKAIEDFDKAIGLNREDHALYNNRAWVYFKQGDLDKAIEDLGKAIELDPKNPMLYNNRAFVYRKQGDLEKAKKDYDKAIELDPKQSDLYDSQGIPYLKYDSQGIPYLKKGDFDNAE